MPSLIALSVPLLSDRDEILGYDKLGKMKKNSA